MKRRLRLSLWAPLMLMAASPVWAQSPAPAPSAKARGPALTPVTSVEGITEYRLANGLRVLLFPDPSKPTVTVNVTYFVGSKHEGYGESGMAHLLEHLLFKGTPTTKNVPQALTERGARPNGTTHLDRTNYFETLPASDENLRWALSFEADRMVNSFISKKDLDSEMTVVRNEFEATENNVRGILFQRIFSAAYLWHHYGKSTIGARSDLENVPIERLRAFYRRYYRPDNAMLVVAGRFDEAKTLGLIQGTFGKLKKPSEPLPATYTMEPTQDGEREVTLRRVGDIPVVASAYHVPEGGHPDFAAIHVLAEVLGDNPSGRLYKSLVETKKAAHARARAFQLRDPGLITFAADLRAGQPVEPAREALVKTVEEAARTPFSEEDVTRAKTSLLKMLELMLNHSERSAISLSEWAATGDWRLMFLQRDRIDAVTVADVMRVAQTYLKPSNRTLGTFIPTPQPDRAQMPAPVDLAKAAEGYKGRAAVAQGEAFDPSPANVEARVQRGELTGGMKYALLPKKTRGEMVNATLYFHWGTEAALSGKSDAAVYAGLMLMRGTKKHSRQQLQDAFDQLKARVWVDGGLMGASAYVECPKASLPKVLELVAEVLREPAFDEKEFALSKQERLAGLEAQRSEPRSQGNLALWRVLRGHYPQGHPHHVPTLEESITGAKDATLEQARAFHQAFYGGSHAEFAVVGDFEPKDVVALSGKLFSAWKSPAPYQRVPGVFAHQAPQAVALETPDKANAVYFAGQLLQLREDDADWPALMLGNFVLGGGFLNSRLATRIRQKDGLSYNVSSSINTSDLDAVGTFTTFAIYAPENAGRLESAMREEVTSAVEKGYSTEELEKARSGLLEYRRTARAQDAGLAAKLARYLFLGRTLSFDAGVEEQLARLGPEQVRQAMSRHLAWPKLTQVKAGDFAGAEQKAKDSVKAPAAR
ncbi:M16B family peptidase [Myxococcus stipitatus DSM 14675]|uniref:M16B family peptidase n=1 Tax=Myxococcus stipitatus (strain DSM 14675 / JCM 12634 / Mx s8) TaxID=1278073 RepID=L7U6H7_MYXSD|nr:pitrilysin family protein [Myxococcus stipitatus]AGC43728.1 M16B family peptidase [Myxococcus stipitatus DSM 14675]